MKLLLYCTKAKPYLYKTEKPMIEKKFRDYHTQLNKAVLNGNCLNGKIVAECDFDVEKIYYSPMFCNYTTWSLGKDELLNKSCLTFDELKDYLGTKDVIGNNGYNGYAIHIKNLHIFDKPIDIRNYYNIATRTMADCMNQKALLKAPQNMCNAYDVYKNHYILISIRPEWLCKILNGEKTIEVRKKVLKEMLE